MASPVDVPQINSYFSLGCYANFGIIGSDSPSLRMSLVFVLSITIQCFISIDALIGFEVWPSFFPIALFYCPFSSSL